MDAIRFGRWLSDRRRLRGWNSQQALAEAAHQHPLLSEYHISEDFLARLEAGKYVHPFRGVVRQRVLALAILLCKTLREVQAYLLVAEFSELSDDEVIFLNRLSSYLATWRGPSRHLPLPPRPTRLFGRAALVQELVTTLSTREAGLCAITGMAGIGKSVLAYEVMHQLALNEGVQWRVFPDGIATFTCTGRRGLSSLVTLLTEIANVFSPSLSPTAHFRQASATPPFPGVTQPEADMSDSGFADAIDRVRLTMAGKHFLLLLDDVEAQFPLRPLLDALFAQDNHKTQGQKRSDVEQAHCMVLTTGRYIPTPTLLTAHFHIGPLEPEAALDLLTALIGHPLEGKERADAQLLCAAVGYLPLAVEVASIAVNKKGIPLSLLATRVAQHPLDRLLDSEQELFSTLAQALEPLEPEMRQRFALLSTLGAQSFGLESAAAIRSPALDTPQLAHRQQTRSGNEASMDRTASPIDRPLAQLTDTAADLGQFVRHSLIELVTIREGSLPLTPSRRSHKNAVRYQIHPLLYAHALDRLSQLEPGIAGAAERDLQAYAQAYIEQYAGDVPRLEHEREILLTALTRAWQQEQYSQVVYFVSKLLHVIGRDGTYKEGERILRWGIDASQHLQDRYHLARFMNRLAAFSLYQGELIQAEQIWQRCLEIAESLGGPVNLWFPLANLAIIAEIRGQYATARRFADGYLQRAEDAADPYISADAFIMRGTYARLQGEGDQACDDLAASLHLLLLHCPMQRFHILLAQAEYARAQKDYALSQEHTETLISLAQETLDLYSIPEILLQQARFAHQEGMLNDSRTLARRTVQLAEQLGALHLRTQGTGLLQQLSSDAIL